MEAKEAIVEFHLTLMMTIWTFNYVSTENRAVYKTLYETVNLVPSTNVTTS